MAFAEQNIRYRAASAAGVLLCHALLAYLLISGLRLHFAPPDSDALAVFDSPSPRPPPSEEVIPPKSKAREPEGAASPPNLKSAATAVVAPKREVPVEAASPVTAAEKPREGPDRASGSAQVEGPGTGSGGTGAGTGSGGSGTGSGSGAGSGTGGAPVTRARLRRGSLSNADYPPDLRRAGVAGRIDVHLTVEPSGRVSNCRVVQSSGSAELDGITCRLVRQRYLFEPARDVTGRPVRDLVGDRHMWWSERRGR